MNLFIKQKQIHRHRKQTSGYQRGKGKAGQIKSMGLTDTQYYKRNWFKKKHTKIYYNYIVNRGYLNKQ